MGASASAIPHSLYKEVMHDIAPAEIEEIDVTIKLSNRDTISPVQPGGATATPAPAEFSNCFSISLTG